MPFGASHTALVVVAKSAITTFFRRIEVYGTDNVPDEGPIILYVFVLG
jgi:1-acyl-sn-glycerol-3-phosphate acyltransferase